MKKGIAWTLRIGCFAVIGAAAFTLGRSLLHINDDHSYAAVMGSTPTAVISQAAVSAASPSPMALIAGTGENENPTVALSADGSATANHSTVRVTAAFRNIDNSIQASLKWYVNGELAQEEEQQLLVEGSTALCDVTIDVDTAESDQAQVTLEVGFAGKTVTADTTIPIALPSGDTVVIKTEEITVTCIQACTIFSDSGLSEDTGLIMYEGDTGLLLGYDTSNSGLSSLNLQFPDGSSGWVSARRNEITTDSCTTEEDYTQEQKVDFVNSMNYDSSTSYLVWVSLYTQRVNIFTGYKGHWELEKSFLCASGVNETPTSTGVFSIQGRIDRWDLGKTYVEPVITFNGGEAFTSQPYNGETDEIADDTIGIPASSGGVRLLPEDIQWMYDNLSEYTMVVVY